MGKPTTLSKKSKFWIESRYCMVLGLKPMGKPTTLSKKYKFWAEPRYCMVLELKPIGARNIVRNVAKPPSARRPSRMVHFSLPILG